MGTKPNVADVVLHPQRFAIVRALTGRALTTKQIAAEVPEIPQATLYRHLAALLDAGAIEVVAERKVRGTPERTYALGRRAVLTEDDFADATREDHLRFFTSFVAGLLDEYGTYLSRDGIDLRADGVGYRRHVVHVTDAELRDLLDEIRAAIARRSENPPSPDRAAILLSTITMPVDHPKTDDPKEAHS